MKLLSVDLARSWWWGHTVDLNPKGIAFYPSLITFLVQMYKFKKFPSPITIPEIPQAPGATYLKFEYGEFAVQEGLSIAVGLSIFAEGLRADTNSSTEHSDAFLSDLLTRYSEIFRSPNYNEVIRKRTYLSQLYVSTNKSLQIVNPKLSKIAASLSQNFDQDARPTFEFGGLSFWADPAKRGPLEPFTFERAVGASFSENRYFSRAPVQTVEHLGLLNKLEGILS